MSIYQDLKQAGCELDCHESDLYVKCDAVSKEIVNRYQFKENVTTFRSQIDGLPWFDIPFAYEPFWDKVRGRDK